MLAVPVAASAQAAIAGTVRDPSGASIPGVLVEARSPALIEKGRTSTTDGAGLYRIEDLPPGTYTVTFTLAGWTPFEQADVVLTGSFTATVNANLIIGSVRQAITVTGEVPAVDVHSAGHEVTLAGDVVKEAPTIRSYNALLVLVPGVVTNVNDTVTATSTTSFPMHG